MKNKTPLYSILFLLFLPMILIAQKDFYQNYQFTEADTLRGMLRPERTCFDVHFYDLNISIDPEKHFIKGQVDMHFKALDDFTKIQVDLYPNMQINRIMQEGHELTFTRKHSAVFINTPLYKTGDFGSLTIDYQGIPTEAKNPPWDGGFIWTEDDNEQAWIGVACEGDGASLWWPNKDHLSDEPDSMSIRVSVPNNLMCISNGNLRQTLPLKNGYTRYDWFVSYPINNYNVTVNIGDYSHFSETYFATDGTSMPLDYYVLSNHVEQAKEHFKQVPKVLKCFENYFGKYPFWKDGYGLVETPYLGMEHQDAIAYGNQFTRGYLGGMIPHDMDWDYIIVHETGHEYFGNSISCNDLSDMWIHESFTTYMEAMYVECAYNYQDYLRYLALFKRRPYILNEEPIIGPKNVNWENWGGSDHYFKGSWVLHTLRHAIHDDQKWFGLLSGFYHQHTISNVNTEDFITYVNKYLGQDYRPFFEQYLEYPSLPLFEYRITEIGDDIKLKYRWKTPVEEFNMPLLVGKKDNYQLIYPTTKLMEMIISDIKPEDFKVATELFLIDIAERK